MTTTHMTTTGMSTDRAARLRALQAVTAAAAETPDLPALARHIASELALCVGAEAAVCLPAGDGQEWAFAGAGAPLPGAPSLLDDVRAQVSSSGMVDVMAARDDLACGDRYALGGVALLPVGTGGRVVGLLGFARPTGARYSADDIAFGQALAGVAALAVAREQLRQQSELVACIPDAIIRVDAEFRITSWNAAAEQIYGHSPREALGRELLALLATQFRSDHGEPMEPNRVLDLLAADQGWRGELRERRVDGAEVLTLSTITALIDAAGELTGAVIVNRDVTQERRRERLKTHDPLTGLPNRALVTTHLERTLARCGQDGRQVALVLLDLNGFAAVNDALGPQAGNEVLRETARRLVQAVRARDMVARVGADEFLIVAEDTGDDGASMLADRLAEAASGPIALKDEAQVCAVSVGVAVSRPGLDDSASLMQAALDALHHPAA